MALKYLTLEHVIETHGITIEVSGGGILGQVNLGQLDGVLKNIQNDMWYPTLIDKLTHLFFCTAQFHCFADGNKRLAISVCAQMLLINGHVFVGEFIRQMENVSYHVASGKIEKELLRDIFEAVFHNEFDSNEELKLRLLHAISEPE